MTATIKYDKHDKNLIDELSKTGHVTHRVCKKKSVTFHHNGGVHISHEAILNIWKTRPASAHFDVDFKGDIAQYVKADEYAWAVGSTEGNVETISIEMTNDTAGPHWTVGDDTFNSAARLAGWLFAHIIKEAPTKHNVFPHQHWSATSCPGPFVMKHFDHLLDEVQKWYHHFVEVRENDDSGKEDSKPPVNSDPDKPPSPPPTAKQKIERIQAIFELPITGVWNKHTDEKVLKFRKAHLEK